MEASKITFAIPMKYRRLSLKELNRELWYESKLNNPEKYCEQIVSSARREIETLNRVIAIRKKAIL